MVTGNKILLVNKTVLESQQAASSDTVNSNEQSSHTGDSEPLKLHSLQFIKSSLNEGEL